MNAKDRNDYNSFKKGKDRKIMGPSPVGYPMYPPLQPVGFMTMPMGRPFMGNFGPYQQMP